MKCTTTALISTIAATTEHGSPSPKVAFEEGKMHTGLHSAIDAAVPNLQK